MRPNEHKEISVQGIDISTQNQIISVISSNDPFPIDFDMAWRWCGYSTKQKAMTKLKGNFSENLDFLTKGLKTSDNGRPSEFIALSRECFKAFGMMAGTKKGKEIRAYFIECEKELISVKTLPSKALSTLQILEMQVSLMKEQETRISGVEDKVNLIEAKISTIDSSYFTVSGYFRLKKLKLHPSLAIKTGKECSRLSYERNIEVGKIKDIRWGYVNTYHSDIIDSAVKSLNIQ